MTSKRLVFPNLFLAGSQKSGTSSLARYLNQHENILLSVPKEPSIFSNQSKATDPNAYRHVFSTGCGSRYRLDASVSYMCVDNVPERIASSAIGEVKFIFIVRNPSERAISAYLHLYKRFDERRVIDDVFNDLPETLDHASDQEMRRIRHAEAAGKIRSSPYARNYDDAYWPFRYLSNGRYSELIARYENVFGKDKVSVVITEELETSPDKVFEQLGEFLQLDLASLVGKDTRRWNATRVPKPGQVARLAHWGLGHGWPSRVFARSAQIRRAYRRFFFEPRSGSDPESIGRLDRLFASETERMSQSTGKDLVEFGWPTLRHAP